MKKIILAVAVTIGLAGAASTAHAGVSFSIGIPAPVVVAPAPVYVAPPPVVYAPAPQVVYAPPAPVVVYSAPRYCVPRVYCPPVPVVRFGFDFGHFRPGYRHGCW